MEKVKIKDLDCLISDGNYSSKYPRSNEFASEGIPFIRCNNFKNNTIVKEDMYYITKEKHAILLKGHVKTGDVLITTRGSLGQVAIVPKEYDDANINAQIVLLRTNPQKINNRYLMWQLKSPAIQYQIMKNKTGTALQQLPIRKLENIEIIIEKDISEQIKITTELDKVQEIIDIRKKQIDELDGLIKSQFVEMFGEPLTSNNYGRITLDKLTKVNQGLQIPISKRHNEGGENRYKYITIQFLNGGKEAEYIENPNTRVVCTKDDILMTRTGNTGQVITNVEGVFHNNFFKVDYDKKKINKEFLIKYFEDDGIYRDMIRRATTSTIPDLSHSEFYKMSIDLPPIELQNKFADFVKQVDKQKFEIKKSLKETQKLQESLINKYFGG